METVLAKQGTVLYSGTELAVLPITHWTAFALQCYLPFARQRLAHASLALRLTVVALAIGTRTVGPLLAVLELLMNSVCITGGLVRFVAATLVLGTALARSSLCLVLGGQNGCLAGGARRLVALGVADALLLNAALFQLGRSGLALVNDVVIGGDDLNGTASLERPNRSLGAEKSFMDGRLVGFGGAVGVIVVVVVVLV